MIIECGNEGAAKNITVLLQNETAIRRMAVSFWWSDLRCGAGRVAALVFRLAAMPFPGLLARRPAKGAAAEIARCLFLPLAAAAFDSTGAPFTPALVQLPPL